MEVTCTENIGTLYAPKDNQIFRNSRVVENLLNDEQCYVPRCNYFEEVQTDIQPFMRKVVTMWMLEVCEEQLCEDSILPLAVNLMDRFLTVCSIKRQQLQLLGATCLLLASKLRSANHLGIDLLCAYTDNSVLNEHISSWELLILSKLQWNLSAVTGFDYIDQIIERCPWGSESNLLRRHANTLVSICYTAVFSAILYHVRLPSSAAVDIFDGLNTIEPNLIQTPPSLIASACICSAMRGLKLPSSNVATKDVCNMTKVDPIALELLVRFIDQTVEKVMPQAAEKNSAPQVKYVSNEQYESTEYGQPETPTDVDNAYFCD